MYIYCVILSAGGYSISARYISRCAKVCGAIYGRCMVRTYKCIIYKVMVPYMYSVHVFFSLCLLIC